MRLMLRLRAPEDGLRWSSPEQWHITLVFLGSVEHEDLALLGQGLGKIRRAIVPVRMDGLGLFERVGVLYAAAEVEPELLRLQQAVAAAARACGFTLEERPYRPHVTLARSRNRGGMRTLERLKPTLERQLLRVDWRAEEFLLYESELTPSGSCYRVRQRFALGG